MSNEDLKVEVTGNKISSELGSCRDAFDQSIQVSQIRSAFKRRPPLLTWTPEKGHIMLLAVNFGSGTTGTHAVHDMMSRLFPPQNVHHYHEMYAAVLRNVRQCLGSSRPGALVAASSCQSRYILGRLAAATQAALTDSVFLSDSPMSSLFPDLLALIPDLISVSTFRDMSSFLQSRSKHHNDDFMCHRSLWNKPGVLHPFDVVACLRLKDTVPAALQSVEHLSRQKSMKNDVRTAYAAQNTVNAILALRGDRLLPLCLQDVRRNESMKTIANAVLGHFKKTNTPWGAKYRESVINASTQQGGPRRRLGVGVPPTLLEAQARAADGDIHVAAAADAAARADVIGSFLGRTYATLGNANYNCSIWLSVTNMSIVLILILFYSIFLLSRFSYRLLTSMAGVKIARHNSCFCNANTIRE